MSDSCGPIDSSPPGSSVPGILQARILKWVAISFSNACMHAKSLSRVRLYATLRTSAHQAPLSTGFSRQEYWSGLPFPSPRETSNSALLTTPKPLTVWITTNCGKFLKRWEYHLRSPHTTVDLSQKAEKQPF